MVAGCMWPVDTPSTATWSTAHLFHPRPHYTNLVLTVRPCTQVYGVMEEGVNASMQGKRCKFVFILFSGPTANRMKKAQVRAFAGRAKSARVALASLGVHRSHQINPSTH